MTGKRNVFFLAALASLQELRFFETPWLDGAWPSSALGLHGFSISCFAHTWCNLTAVETSPELTVDYMGEKKTLLTWGGRLDRLATNRTRGSETIEPQSKPSTTHWNVRECDAAPQNTFGAMRGIQRKPTYHHSSLSATRKCLRHVLLGDGTPRDEMLIHLMFFCSSFPSPRRQHHLAGTHSFAFHCSHARTQ